MLKVNQGRMEEIFILGLYNTPNRINEVKNEKKKTFNFFIYLLIYFVYYFSIPIPTTNLLDKEVNHTLLFSFQFLLFFF